MKKVQRTSNLKIPEDYELDNIRSQSIFRRKNISIDAKELRKVNELGRTKQTNDERCRKR